MTDFRYEIPLRIVLVSPFATRGLVADRASLDLPLARDENGQFILPGTLITGVLRAALARLAEARSDEFNHEGENRKLSEDVSYLFGCASKQDPRASQEGWLVSNEPARGQLVIRDLFVDRTSAPPLLSERRDYPRICIDGQLGSVREGFLQFVEMPYAIGEHVPFIGIADLKRGEVGLERTVALLRKALALVPAIGAIKSSGFGQIADFDVSPANSPAKPIHTGSTSKRSHDGGTVLKVAYSIDRPFVVGGSMASANLYRGSWIIPGAAIKGTLAEALVKAKLSTPEMQAFLADLTIGHAFPRPSGCESKPWHPLPLSLAVAKQGSDQILFERLLASEERPSKWRGRWVTLAYGPDMKGADSLIRWRCDFGCALPRYDVRTRTKIDPKRGNASFEDDAGQLFSYAAVCPQGFEWVGRMVLPENTDPGALEVIEGILKQGVVGFGKTAALLTALIETAAVDGPSEVGDCCALTLMTPAALNDLDALRQGRSLFDDYAAYWQRLGYTLKRFFATQELFGGHIALRYPPKAGRCEPYLLTQPGSVFLLEPAPNAVPIQQLLARGLPPTLWIDKPTWQGTPFLPTNGFGEVRLNVVDHRGLLDGRVIDLTRKQAA